jgi:glycosyltransferase-like protein
MPMSGRTIALLAHSTNPRGGVVHALELGDALTRLGHAATVHAPAEHGRDFFRQTLCRTVTVPASPVGANTTTMVETRIADYVRYFEQHTHRRFDVFHAQDGISANALATLKDRGLIGAFARTVHHIDFFPDPRLQSLQDRSIASADQLFVVSQLVRGQLQERFQRDATIVGNGVDLKRFSERSAQQEADLRQRLELRSVGPIFLSIGGIEARKNTTGILEAFAQVWQIRPDATLVIAGGASVLDHKTYQADFKSRLRDTNLPPSSVRIVGEVAQADMPALYRLADCLVFPSLKEGFGLVVLEAMASGIPVVTSRIPPFTEYLSEPDAIWCDPRSSRCIADAMLMALSPSLRPQLIAAGLRVAARHDWQTTAEAHLGIYETLMEAVHA